jgi:histone deacetylase 1/2
LEPLLTPITLGPVAFQVIQRIMDWFRPGAVILQCGADSLAGDKLGMFNLSMKGHADCVRFLNSFNVPLMLVGGGGYTTKVRSSLRARTV